MSTRNTLYAENSAYTLSFADTVPLVNRVCIRLPRRTHTREVWEKLRRRKKGLSKRKKGVILHLGRLITFLSYFPKLGDGELLKRGKFRSMRRRLFNFERLRPESVDMTRIEKTGAVSFGHMTRVFAALDHKAYPGMKKSTLSLCIKHIPQCEEWVDALLRDVEPMDTKQMYQNWIAQKEEDRAISWIHILVWLLDHQPDRALQFVHVLASGPSFNRVFGDSRSIGRPCPTYQPRERESDEHYCGEQR